MEHLGDLHPCTPPRGEKYFTSDIRLECTEFFLGYLTFFQGSLHVYQDRLNTEPRVGACSAWAIMGSEDWSRDLRAADDAPSILCECAFFFKTGEETGSVDRCG